MKGHRIWVLSLLVYALMFGLQAQEKEENEKPKPVKTTVEAILKDPAKFDKKWVQVEGTVSELKKKTSQKGNAYTTFWLKSQEQTIQVFAYGHLSVADGDKVSVIGKYFKERKVGSRTFKNEIDATARDGGKVEKIK